MKIYIVFFLFFAQTFGQNVLFHGKLLDSETKEPVVYANISFLNSDKGISSQENGEFELTIEEKILQSKVHISCLNYRDTIIFAKEMLGEILYLKPKSYQLNEVVISRKKNKEIILDNVKNKVTPFHSHNIRMIAKYFPNELSENFFLKKIKIFFANNNSKKAKFRIRIFSKDSKSNYPKEDLLPINIPISLDKGQKSIDINLEEFYLDFPKDGVFIVFEKLLIPYNLYEFKNFGNSKDEYYAPVIGITKSKQFKKLNRVSVFINGKWFEVPMNTENYNFVSAISLTLSN